MQPIKPFRFQCHLDLSRQKYSGPASHFHFHEDYGEFACLFRAPASFQPRRVVQMASFSEFVLGQLDHIQDVGGMFPKREIFGDEVNAVDPRSDEGRQGVIAGNGNDVAGEALLWTGFPSISELPGPDCPEEKSRPSLPEYEFEFPCCEFSMVVQLNKPVSIPPVMRRIRSQGSPKFLAHIR